MNLILVFAITIALSQNYARGLQDKCLGLVLKGGANRGSYEAGAVYALVRNLPPEEVQYDVVSGISVGALNAAHCATYPKGEEIAMSEDLLTLWTNLTAGHLYKSWTGGIIQGLLFKKGLYDSTPLHEFIEDYFDNRTMHRKIHINSVDCKTGNIVEFDENSEKESFLKGLMATTAVPFVFPSVKYEDKILLDGGVAWNLDIASAIEKCRTLVDSDSKIVLDIIDVDRSLKELPKISDSGNTITNVFRYLNIKSYYERMNDHFVMQYAHPEVEFRHVIIPENQLDPLYKELSMDSRLIQRMINQGMHDALNVIEKTKQKAKVIKV